MIMLQSNSAWVVRYCYVPMWTLRMCCPKVYTAITIRFLFTKEASSYTVFFRQKTIRCCTHDQNVRVKRDDPWIISACKSSLREWSWEELKACALCLELTQICLITLSLLQPALSYSSNEQAHILLLIPEGDLTMRSWLSDAYLCAIICEEYLYTTALYMIVKMRNRPRLTSSINKYGNKFCSIQSKAER